MKKKFGGHSKKGGIYKISDNYGNFYIGSAKEFKRRASQHETGLDKGKHHNKRLLNLWKKHGKDNFLFEILEVVEGTTHKRRSVEQKYIDRFWGNPNFLNHKRKVTKTQGPWSSTPEETRKKMRLAKLGKIRGPHSEETKKKIGKANSKKKRSEEEKQHLRKVMLGKCRSAETKQKISKTMKEKGLKPPSWLGKHHSDTTKHKLSKQVIQLNDKMEPLAVFASLTEASMKSKVDTGSISKCCNNKRKSAGGYIWKYQFTQVKND